jgi:hypothetical protein
MMHPAGSQVKPADFATSLASRASPSAASQSASSKALP